MHSHIDSTIQFNECAQQISIIFTSTNNSYKNRLYKSESIHSYRTICLWLEHHSSLLVRHLMRKNARHWHWHWCDRIAISRYLYTHEREANEKKITQKIYWNWSNPPSYIISKCLSDIIGIQSIHGQYHNARFGEGFLPI